MPIQSATLRKADRLGIVASTLCAIHCALLPLAAALLPALGLGAGGWVDFDQGFVVFASILAVATLTLGWRRHRAYRAFALLVPGLALVWFGAFSPLHDHDLRHALVMTAGGVLLALAHLVNLRLTHRIASV